jgi:DNA (cytosine-5)-methyltransferase 1
MNSKYYVPQNRNRIFIVGFHNNFFKTDTGFQFPDPENQTTELPKLKDILEKEVEDKYTLSEKMWNCLLDHANKQKEKGNGFRFGLADVEGSSKTLLARYYKDGSEILIPQKDKMPRKLTPRECARLQGFPDTFVIPVSNTQAYKQFGNSVTVPLVEEIAKKIKEKLLSNNY